MQIRLEQSPDAMRTRRCTVEHPFGTIKSWMGATHFLTKGIERVKTEMSLHVLAYNLKRLMALLGIAGFMEAVRAHALLMVLQHAFGAITLLCLPSCRKLAAPSTRAINGSRKRKVEYISVPRDCC